MSAIATIHPDAGPLAELARAEQVDPRRRLLRWRGGQLSVSDFAGAVRAAAGDLAHRGVQPGDRVAVMAGNSHRTLIATYAIWALGAVEVAVNAEIKGAILRHVLQDSDPSLIVCDVALGPVIARECPDLVQVDLAGLDIEPRAQDAAQIRPLPEPGALASLLYTSGTTGPSKGVMIPHGYYSHFAQMLGAVIGLSADDTCYFTLPFFHVDAHIALPASLRWGSTLAFAERFSVTSFWSDVEEFGATWFGAVGSMLSALISRGTPPAGALEHLRLIMAAPIPDEAFAFFEDGLGITVLQMYGQTEANGPLYSTVDRRRRGATGWPCAGFDVRIVDESGHQVAPGEVGQLVIRPDAPHTIAQGYWRRPEATAEAFRDGWFHTGDLARQDADDFVWYVGRQTDSLRRRGENISAFELEAVLRSAPGVHEGAALAVRDELGGEDDIKAVLVVTDGFDLASFLTYCRAELPRFAVPRYVEIVQESQLVRGPGTGAVQKHLLPQGITEATVDLQASEAIQGASSPIDSSPGTHHQATRKGKS